MYSPPPSPPCGHTLDSIYIPFGEMLQVVAAASNATTSGTMIMNAKQHKCDISGEVDVVHLDDARYYPLPPLFDMEQTYGFRGNSITLWVGLCSFDVLGQEASS